MFGEKFRDRQKPMVLVLGLGESGLAMARWCARHGCRLRVADTREVPPNLSALEAHGVDAAFVGGPFSPVLLEGVELFSWPGGPTSAVHSDEDLRQTAYAFRSALGRLEL